MERITEGSVSYDEIRRSLDNKNNEIRSGIDFEKHRALRLEKQALNVQGQSPMRKYFQRIVDTVDMWLARISDAFTSEAKQGDEIITLGEFIDLILKTREEFREEYSSLEGLNNSIIENVSCTKESYSNWINIKLRNLDKSPLTSKSIGECNLYIAEHILGNPHALLIDADGEIIPLEKSEDSERTIKEYARLFSKYSGLFNLCTRLQENDSMFLKRNGIEMNMTMNETNAFLVHGLNNLNITFKNWLDSYRVSINVDANNKYTRELVIKGGEWHGTSVDEILKRIEIEKSLLTAYGIESLSSKKEAIKK